MKHKSGWEKVQKQRKENGKGLPAKYGKEAKAYTNGIAAVQNLSPNFEVNACRSSDAAVSPWINANVVEPLPDIRVTAPFWRKNSWKRYSKGYFFNAGASNEL